MSKMQCVVDYAEPGDRIGIIDKFDNDFVGGLARCGILTVETFEEKVATGTFVELSRGAIRTEDAEALLALEGVKMADVDKSDVRHPSRYWWKSDE